MCAVSVSPVRIRSLSTMWLRRSCLRLSGALPGANLVLDDHHWLRLSTLSGARALGLGDSIGSLTPGKWADVCCLDLARPHTPPVYDVAAQIVFAASRDQVTDVWVAGRALVSESRLTRLDPADIIARAERWRDRIAGVRSA